MKNVLLITLVFILASCTRNDQVRIEYVATNAISEFEVFYLDESGGLMDQTIAPESAVDRWTYTYTGEIGDVVYISGRYSDPNSALKLLVKVNGKIYKQAQNEGDTLKFLTVSGVAR